MRVKLVGLGEGTHVYKRVFHCGSKSHGQMKDGPNLNDPVLYSSLEETLGIARTDPLTTART